MPRIPATQRSPYETIGRRPKADAASTAEIASAVSDANRPRGPPDDGDLLGAFTIPEFSLRYRMCRSVVYSEARAGRLKLSKVGSRTIITRTEAARYQQALEAEAVELSEPAHLAKAKAEKSRTQSETAA